VFRARPKRALFGTFFDVPNLMEVAARFAGLLCLEEESEAQEGQGVGVRQRATTLRTDSTETASKVASSMILPRARRWKQRRGEG